MKKVRYLLIIIILSFTYGCKEQFTPPAGAGSGNNQNFLVVEGFINASANDSTIIKLSRVVGLTSSNTVSPEKNAVVTIESNNNTINLGLTEVRSGVYLLQTNQGLNTNLQYRLRIKTSNGKEYTSDFTECKTSPPIDSVSYKVLGDNLQFYVSTHDVTNNSRYYRWTYDETYIFHSAYQSETKIVAGQFIERTPADEIYFCWRTNQSDTSIINSTTKLSQDIVINNRVVSIPAKSGKMNIRYSILVKQQVYTKEAFEFWQNLKTTTENLGSIFDAQPSQIKGNIHNVSNANELVVGYINTTTLQTRRIFINNNQLPPNFLYDIPTGCSVINVKNINLPAEFLTNPPLLLPIEPTYPGPGSNVIIGYSGSTAPCVDCTLMGTNKQPAFWQ